MLVEISVSAEKNKSQSCEMAREILFYRRRIFFQSRRENSTVKFLFRAVCRWYAKEQRDVRCKGILIGRIAVHFRKISFHVSSSRVARIFPTLASHLRCL